MNADARANASSSRSRNVVSTVDPLYAPALTALRELGPGQRAVGS